jgi:uncharacterized Zn finger protein
MAREDAATKARRLLGEGRITLVQLGPTHLMARARGDSGMEYRVTWEAGAGATGSAPPGWHCNCEARGRCSHIRAVQLVTVITDQQVLPTGGQE